GSSQQFRAPSHSAKGLAGWRSTRFKQLFSYAPASIPAPGPVTLSSSRRLAPPSRQQSCDKMDRLALCPGDLGQSGVVAGLLAQLADARTRQPAVLHPGQVAAGRRQGLGGPAQTEEQVDEYLGRIRPDRFRVGTLGLGLKMP